MARAASYSHPSNRQLQADLGKGVGHPCPSQPVLHNRTVTLNPGEILLVSPYYVHYIESIGGSLSYSISYLPHESDFHERVKAGQ
jgi:hypothetical protein